ncbi:hypothetical protein ABT157_37610 [Streptomyces viridosporus]
MRDDLQEYVAEKLGEPDGVLIIDDTPRTPGAAAPTRICPPAPTT